MIKDDIENRTNYKTVEPYNNCSINETRPVQNYPDRHNQHDDKTNKPLENYSANKKTLVIIKNVSKT